MLVYLDIGETNKISLQEEGTAIQAGIIDLHNKVIFYMIIIFSIVLYLLFIRIFGNRSINWLRNFNHSLEIEIIWTLLPGIILIIIAIPSLKLLYTIDEVIKPEITIKAIGSQWFWSYEIGEKIYDSYTKRDDELYFGELRLYDVDNKLLLPIYKPIRLLVTAHDVIHSFFVPSLGIKIDAIPGRINHSSLNLIRKGIYYGTCTELCGAGHERMNIVIEAI